MLYLAYQGNMYEVEILKETPKQYQLKSNRSCLSRVDRSSLDTPRISYGAICYLTVFSFDRDKCIEIYNKAIEDYIENEMRELDKLKENMINN